MSHKSGKAQSTEHVNTQTQVISVEGLTEAQVAKLKQEISRQVGKNSQVPHNRENKTHSKLEKTVENCNSGITHKILTLGNDLVDQVYKSICEILNLVDEKVHAKNESQNSIRMEEVQSFKRKVKQIRKNLGNLQRYSEQDKNFVRNKNKIKSGLVNKSKPSQHKKTWVNPKSVSQQNRRKENRIADYANVTCRKCQLVGHFARDCREQLTASRPLQNPITSENSFTPSGENPFVNPTLCINPYVIYTNTDNIFNQSQQYVSPPMQANFYST